MQKNDNPKPGSHAMTPATTADSFFKTYDCRGLYGTEATEEKCFWLGTACNAYRRPIVLGMDYRPHNESLASAFLQGFSGDLRFAGNVPSPVVAFNAAAWGVSFTASHNPAGYNGVKFKKHKRCFFENELAQLRQWYEAAKKAPFVFQNKTLPTLDEQIKTNYTNALPQIQEGIFDLGGGAACALKDVFPQTVFDVPDPRFEKRPPEPKEDTLSVLAAKTKSEKKVGFAFDGDADRCVAVDNGQVIDGGILSAFIALRFPKKSKILLTLDTQAEVVRRLQDAGYSVGYTAVGDVYIVKALLDQKADFAAERSGHFSFAKHMPDSDGIYAAAFLSDCKPGELLEFSKTFKNVSLKDEVRFAVDFEKLKSLVADQALRVDDLDGIKAEMDDFTFLARASKTEPKVRVNVEAASVDRAKKGLTEVLIWLGQSKRQS